MVQVGEQAPQFELMSDKGETVRLSDYLGRKVVLYFYPKADTSGCTTQACALRDAYPQIEAKDAVVIGISPDEPRALVAFREKYALPFILLSDPDHAVAEAYGAWGEKKMYGKTYDGLIRSHFAVDAEGRLSNAEIAVKPLSTADLALKLIEL
ncbi:MAG: thioredoxin-dependent thiol peroxidase [Anaerolineae bacterium]|jgi:peroxiredoxin Q/BCP|nr:thioredoxin-dependent thiol peroxidase [Anaerolineae bacterium]